MSSEDLLALRNSIGELTAAEPTVEMLGPSIYLIAAGKELSIIYYLQGACKAELPARSGKVIHLDQDVWIRKPQLVTNRLKVHFGKGQRLYARKGVIARLDKQRAVDFQQEHHLQQAVPGKYRYGLFIDGELSALMVFSGGRLMRHTEGHRSFECLRFCSRQGTVVIGAFSRLLSFFVKEFGPDDVMTYVDRDWSDGAKFRPMGFVPAGVTQPQRFWVDRYTYQRISEKEYDRLPELAKGGYYLVENSGSLKMLKVLNQRN